jgi:hypothetical protein
MSSIESTKGTAWVESNHDLDQLLRVGLIMASSAGGASALGELREGPGTWARATPISIIGSGDKHHL